MFIFVCCLNFTIWSLFSLIMWRQEWEQLHSIEQEEKCFLKHSRRTNRMCIFTDMAAPESGQFKINVLEHSKKGNFVTTTTTLATAAATAEKTSACATHHISAFVHIAVVFRWVCVCVVCLSAHMTPCDSICMMQAMGIFQCSSFSEFKEFKRTWNHSHSKKWKKNCSYLQIVLSDCGSFFHSWQPHPVSPLSIV